jgi:predicted O-methyltransferase YrrM
LGNSCAIVDTNSDWTALLTRATETAARVEGWLQPSEIRFLALIGAYPTAQGRVVELGAYRGKSTTILAMASKQTATPGIVSVDPIDSAPLLANLRREGVMDLVEFHGMYSHEFWPKWRDDIRLLWHDGANDRTTVHTDVMTALPFLVDRAIVAFHDVRNTSGERVHVFIDDILGSPHFGASGVCGCIGWSQYRSDVADTRAFQPQKAVLRRKLERLRPYHDLTRGSPHGLRKHHYKVLRWFVPHGDVVPDQWMREVSATNAS